MAGNQGCDIRVRAADLIEAVRRRSGQRLDKGGFHAAEQRLIRRSMAGGPKESTEGGTAD
jgi:hypothetical protein